MFPPIGIQDHGLDWEDGEAGVPDQLPNCSQICVVALQKYTDPGLNMMLIGTWNEFGEGSHIEPTVAKGM